MYRIFLTYLFSLACLAGITQPKQYSFMHHGTNDGLASHEVYSIVQDADGYIWVGTNNGLQRFDGIRYRSFRATKGDPYAIPNNNVIQILYDKNKNLWVVTNDGKIGRMNTKTLRYTESKVKISQEAILRYERKLLEDQEGNIFLSYANADFLTLDSRRNEFSAANNFIRFPRDWRVTSCYQQKGTRKYWIGGAKGLAVYDRETNLLSYAGNNRANEPAIEALGKVPGPTNLHIDRQGRLWFDAWIDIPALFCYDLKKNTIILNEYRYPGKGYHEIKGVLEQKDGTIWLKGLAVFARFQEKDRRFEPVLNQYRNEQSINYDRIYDLYEDIENNVWIATNNNGVYRFNPASQFFTNVRQINRRTGEPGDGAMMSFMYTRNKTLLAGAWGDGLFEYDSNYRMTPFNYRGFNPSNPASMWTMYQSRDSNIIWMGGQPGIIRMNVSARTIEYYNPKIMNDRTVRQVAEDQLGNLWMGTQSLGLFKWNPAKGNKRFEDGITHFDAIPNSGIPKIIISRDGLVWVATFAQGIYVIDPSRDSVVMHFGMNEEPARKLVSDNLVSMLQYDDTTIILGASSLHIFNTRTREITRKLAMPESIPNSIAAMERDRQGYLWISTTSGIFRVNLERRIFIHFDRIDGIGNDRFVIAASHLLPDGRIIFGADNQFVVFNPAEVTINQVSPDVKFTGFQLMNTSLQLDSLLSRKRVNLSPEDNSIVIEFSGLRYNGTYLIRYKLEGLDKDWITADKTSQAVYSYLPPGRYTFLVQSLDAEGKVGKKTTSLEIVVNPPFWRTWWFFCILALVMVAVFFWIDRERMKRLKALQSVRTEIAGNLHEEVNSTLNNINLLSEMARIKADKDIDRSKEYIDQISTKSHNMIIAMDDILWSIDPQNDNMQKSLLRMMEFTDALKQRHGANIELALDRKVRSLKLDMKTRHEVFFIFKKALRMIVQYAGGKETLVHIDLFKNKLSLKLQDATADLEKNSADIDEAIREMHDRAGIIQADLDVQYDKNGIAVILLVPVK